VTGGKKDPVVTNKINKMTEKEKCHLGLLYDANYDKELLADRERVKELLYDYNRLRPSQQEEKTQLLKSFLGKTGNSLIIEPPFACDYGYNIEVGENFYANVNLVILDGAKVRIGANAFIAPNVGIYTAGHPLDAEQRNRGLEYARPVTIGDNVWIGAGVNILPGVTIGDNTVIGAGSVVTKDIPSNVLAVGNPCRVVKEIK
jgi:maltose O-acetyltransferase